MRTTARLTRLMRTQQPAQIPAPEAKKSDGRMACLDGEAARHDYGEVKLNAFTTNPEFRCPAVVRRLLWQRDFPRRGL